MLEWFNEKGALNQTGKSFLGLNEAACEKIPEGEDEGGFKTGDIVQLIHK